MLKIGPVRRIGNGFFAILVGIFVFLSVAGRFGSAPEILSLAHIATLARLIVKYPACQLLGEK